ncbi:PDZ/DHR/GLGF domain-containing protein [Aeromicrobium sp. A1-2]|uniref:YlbL family protein n=1 Tax=Aeromicrobium sp. A1-2 TaxID=2107713 RepID=UPI000E54FEAF|nr:PDZ domain-containing protein [Aeromicrobium sp. A1-2]AXT84209.1 PDZ/DHR/GLGF domain-containing protein [Aeromicrobium sp. A1-2]
MSDPSKLSTRYTTMVVATVSLIVLSTLAFIVPVPYVTLKPGPAFDTLGDFDGKPTFTFGKDVTTYPTTGSLDFTTVSVTRPGGNLSLAEAITAYLDRDNAVVPKSLIYPDNQSNKQSTAESAAELSSSKDSSRVAALREAGYTVTSQVAVTSLVKGGASEKVLKVGDIVTKVDGTEVSNPDQTVKAVGVHEPGDTIDMTVERKGVTTEVSIVSLPDADDATIPRIGITLGEKYRYPISITNNVGSQIGGPSAGAMFALAIYDNLTPRSLTGGKRIAGTGEMLPDGTVGPIGGVRQKMAGASAAGATIFLVPAANCAEASDGDDDGLRLVKITKLKDAISSLEALAKDSTATVPTCS